MQRRILQLTRLRSIKAVAAPGVFAERQRRLRGRVRLQRRVVRLTLGLGPQRRRVRSAGPVRAAVLAGGWRLLGRPPAGGAPAAAGGQPGGWRVRRSSHFRRRRRVGGRRWRRGRRRRLGAAAQQVTTWLSITLCNSDVVLCSKPRKGSFQAICLTPLLQPGVLGGSICSDSDEPPAFEAEPKSIEST